MQQNMNCPGNELFVHIRLGECEFEARGASETVERQVTQFYHNAVYINGGRHARNDKKEEAK
jgi:hypothetical protein